MEQRPTPHLKDTATVPVLSDRERTAACVMHMAAGFAYECHRDRGWYTWCVENAIASAGAFERGVWTALRFEQLGDPNRDFFVHLRKALRRPDVSPVGGRDAQWLIEGLALEQRRVPVPRDRHAARWLRDAYRPSELPPAAVGDQGASRHA